MRYLVTALVPLLFISCQSGPQPSATTATTQASPPPLEFRWTPAQTSNEEAAEVRAFAEDAHAALSGVLGRPTTSLRTIVVRLEGDAVNNAQPTVDLETGDIRLFRYPDSGYTASLAHEMVHALRWELWTDPARQTDAFLFVEEGFAETAAEHIGRGSTGFPTYGFPVAVAAGAWLDDHADQTLLALIHGHKALNFRCMGQAYPLRLSFMRFLVERFGFAALVQLAQTGVPMTPATIGQHYKTPLAPLTQQWRAWAEKQRDNVPASAQAIADFRASPIQYLPHCARDVFDAVTIDAGSEDK